MTCNSLRKFTKEHEWISQYSEGFKVGISDYAQKELGDVVFVDLPEVGAKLIKGESFMTVESVKAVSDIYSPVDGEVLEVNPMLAEKPELVNTSPYSEAWLVVVKVDDMSQLDSLMCESDYQSYVGSL